MHKGTRFGFGTLCVLYFGYLGGCAFQDPCDPAYGDPSACEESRDSDGSPSVTGQKEAVTEENAIGVIGYVRGVGGIGFVPGARVFVVRTEGEEAKILDETISADDHGAFTLSVPELGQYTVLAGYEGTNGNYMGSDDLWVNGDGNPMDINLAPVPEGEGEDQVEVSADGAYETQEQALSAGCWCAARAWNFHYVCCSSPRYAWCFWTWRGCD